ncbi:MAG: hypothetical protein ACO36I_14540 [Candidatus Latescibacterota bacterium]|jgi:hypothetical protein
MDWVFIVFAIATVMYTLVVVKEYLASARIQGSLLEILKAEHIDLEDKIKVNNLENSEISEEIKKGKEAVKELQDIVNNQQIEIRKLEETMAKKGKFRVE